MGYAAFSGKNISRALSLSGEAPERPPAFETMRKVRIVHGASLILVLIFCKRLSGEVRGSNPLSSTRKSARARAGSVFQESLKVLMG